MATSDVECNRPAQAFFPAKQPDFVLGRPYLQTLDSYANALNPIQDSRCKRFLFAKLQRLQISTLAPASAFIFSIYSIRS